MLCTVLILNYEDTYNNSLYTFGYRAILTLNVINKTLFGWNVAFKSRKSRRVPNMTKYALLSSYYIYLKDKSDQASFTGRHNILELIDAFHQMLDHKRLSKIIE